MNCLETLLLMLGNAHFIKRKPTRYQSEPTKNRPSINQNHVRIDQETSSPLYSFTAMRDSFAPAAEYLLHTL